MGFFAAIVFGAGFSIGALIGLFIAVAILGIIKGVTS